MTITNTFLRSPHIEHRLKRWSEHSYPMPRHLAASATATTLANGRKRKGHGETTFPHPLDIIGISAPGTSQACLRPKYQTIRCFHGNRKCVPLRCGKCDGCRQFWRKKVRAIVGAGCEGHASYFVTLTFREYPSQMDCNRYDFAQEAWHALLRLAAKRGITFQYIRVVELQERGTPHFHLVVNRIARYGAPIRTTAQVQWLFRQLAKKTGFGPQMMVERARLGGKGAASYLSKYLSKSEVFAMKRDDGRAIRRYCRSRKWCHRENKSRFRFSAVGAVLDNPLHYPEPTCECYSRQRVRENYLAARWFEACLREGYWCAPMALYDHLLNETRD